MNIAALSKLNGTIEKIDNQISALQTLSVPVYQTYNLLDILRTTHNQLLLKQKTLKQNVSNLHIVTSNVESILRQEPSKTMTSEKTQEI